MSSKLVKLRDTSLSFCDHSAADSVHVSGHVAALFLACKQLSHPAVLVMMISTQDIFTTK